MIVYVPSPVSAIVGELEVSGVRESTPSGLWRLTRKDAGLRKAAFDDYFRGASTAFCIDIETAIRFEEPLELRQIRRHDSRFSPPQCFWYLSSARRRDRILASLLS